MKLSAIKLVLLVLPSIVYPQATYGQEGSLVVKYPDRAIRFIVPFPPGAGNDLLARALGQRLADRWGQPVVVDNRSGGGGGTFGTAIAAKAMPDGYTIVLVPASHAINVSLYSKPTYDAIKDFAAIGRIATGPYMLAVNPSLPIRSVKELIMLAKSRPGQLSYGTAGIGNATHLIGELLNSMAGIEITHIQYKGTNQALMDVIGGQVQMMFGTISATYPQAKSSKVRALAVTSAKRSSAAPEVPTLDEAGVVGFDAVGWWGVLAPAGTSIGVVTELNRKIVEIVSSAEMRRWLQGQGFEPAAGSPEHFARFIKDEIVKWGKLVKASGARSD